MNRKSVLSDIVCVCVCVDSTYNDQQNEVDEVVEGMCVHHVVHDLHPALQGDYLPSEEGAAHKNNRCKTRQPVELKHSFHTHHIHALNVVAALLVLVFEGLGSHLL